jgi:hypothetical protein
MHSVHVGTAVHSTRAHALQRTPCTCAYSQHAVSAAAAAAASLLLVRFGYNGVPDIDNCWDNKMTSNDTAPVVPPGNLRGYVSFSMNALPNKTEQTPYCTYPVASYCAIGFSQNIFINLDNNTRLDGPGFAIFGVVPAEDMAVVDRIYGGYGEVTELCPASSNSTYCNGYGECCCFSAFA